MSESRFIVLYYVLMAASARKIGGAIVTNNVKDFQRIQEYLDFKIYKG